MSLLFLLSSCLHSSRIVATNLYTYRWIKSFHLHAPLTLLCASAPYAVHCQHSFHSALCVLQLLFCTHDSCVCWLRHAHNKITSFMWVCIKELYFIVSIRHTATHKHYDHDTLCICVYMKISEKRRTDFTLFNSIWRCDFFHFVRRFHIFLRFSSQSTVMFASLFSLRQCFMLKHFSWSLKW